MAQHMARFEEIGLTAEVEEQLESISRATVGRILSKHRSRARRLPQKGAERANQVRHRSADGTHPVGHQRARAL